MSSRSQHYLSGLVHELRGLPAETEWVELKTNNADGQAIGEYISALANAAALEGKAAGYLVWGIEDANFFLGGAGPTVEVFSDRIEITNPGVPLVEAERLLDTPPRSRNEILASMMRRVGVCEERGSGIDKVVFQTELYQLPAPIFEVTADAMRSVLFAHRPLSKMDKSDRIRACYLHACLKFVNREFMTNSSLRERFGIETKNSATASRLIKEALEAGVIASHDASAAPKLMKYVPGWAVEEQIRAGLT